MSTVPITCPNCGAWVRVAVQPSRIVMYDGGFKVQFDDQTVAHKCKEKK